MCAITCYFNPIRYTRRQSNYRVFREHLNIPLVTVELSYGSTFELRLSDADILIQLHGHDILWQKERLLNVALHAVPRQYDKIAWLDCDFVSANEDWHQAASQMLDQKAMVHLFRRWNELRIHALPHNGSNQVEDAKESIVCQYLRGAYEPQQLRPKVAPQRVAAWGLGWAARRELLEEIGFYDACIVGGGDMVMFCAAVADYGFAISRLGMNPSQIMAAGSGPRVTAN